LLLASAGPSVPLAKLAAAAWIVNPSIDASTSNRNFSRL